MYRRTTMICSFILEEEILVCFELREYFRFCYNSFPSNERPFRVFFLSFSSHFISSVSTGGG